MAQVQAQIPVPQARRPDRSWPIEMQRLFAAAEYLGAAMLVIGTLGGEQEAEELWPMVQRYRDEFMDAATRYRRSPAS